MSAAERRRSRAVARLPLFLVLILLEPSFVARFARGQSPCGECSGGISELALRYRGAAPAVVDIVEQPAGKVVFYDAIVPGQEILLGADEGGVFGGPLDIFVSGAPHASIDTSCATAIGPGFVCGDFKVAGGLSPEGGRLCSVSGCVSSDPTFTGTCYGERSDGELKRLLFGTASKPFSAPAVCGRIVNTPNIVRELVGSTACRGLRREALTAILNIRRSVLFGDGLLGDDGPACFQVSPFALELRCGEVFIPDPATPDPEDAAVATQETPLSVLVDLALALCDAADCPASGNPCETTARALRDVLRQVNESRSMLGDCRICPGDEIGPTLTCPEGRLTVECQGPEGARVDYMVTAHDDCDPEPTVTCSPPSGSLFPPGAPQAVECLARDVKRNSCVCSFEVQVVDSTPPAIQCPPGPIVVDCAAGGEAGAVVSYPAPTATDLCDPEPIMVCDPPSGSLFPFGLTTVTCTAMDDAGNMARCTVDVMVVEDTPAQLLCQGDMTVACTGPEGATVEYPLPTATDSCRPPENLRCTPPPGSVFPLGRTTVLCSADVEGGGTITCSFNVTVSDTGRPSIQCPADMSVECGAPVAFNVTATDTCDPNPTVTCVPPPGSPFPPGRTVVNCTAVDAAGNSALCSFAVTVSDRTPPAITCPADMTVSCTTAGQPPHKPPGWPPGANPPPNPCNAVAEFAVPAARDDCDGAGLPVTCTPPSGTSLALGMHTVTCLARDAAGNESMCTFTVNVVRGEPAFIRGDANADGTIDIADAIFALNHLFLGSREPTCADTADANDNGEILLEDPILMINYQFMGGRAPNAPFLPVCGLDPTADDVGCGRYLPCE